MKVGALYKTLYSLSATDGSQLFIPKNEIVMLLVDKGFNKKDGWRCQRTIVLLWRDRAVEMFFWRGPNLPGADLLDVLWPL